MRIANGREVLTIFSLSDLERTGAAHGELYTDLHSRETVDFGIGFGTNATPKVVTETGLQGVLIEELVSSGARRVYYYGDQLKTVDIAEVCAVAGSEMVLRSPHVHDDIVHADRRLQQIADRPLTQEQLTIVNGLPQDREAVEKMGPFVGDPNRLA
jgi:hypothetical protein